MELALVLLRYLWPFLLAGAVWGAQEVRVLRLEHQASAAEARAVKVDAQLAAAQKRASDLALLWAGSVEQADAAVRAAERKRDDEFAQLQARADRVPDRVVVFSGIAGRLFTDITGAANAAGSAPIGEGGTQTIPADAAVGYSERALADFLVESAKAYREAREKWEACVTFYDGLRADEGKQ